MQFLAIPWKIFVQVSKLRGGNSVCDAVISSVSDIVEEAESSVQAIHEKEDSPLMEEIAIPSVSELSRICVKFRPTKGGINSIKFDKSSATFYLPALHLNENSDVLWRNLVAYEVCIAPEAMVFTRYTELMNGIIDTEEDVKILREAGILLNRLKIDEAVATLWNGMTTSVNVTKVPLLDKAIEGVNGYYSASWKVKMKATMKTYVYACWPCLTFLAANVLIFMSVLETFCSFYRCSIWGNYKVDWEGSLGRVSMKMVHLIGHTRRKAVHQAILRDIMLENQIPLFLVREVYTFYQPKNKILESTTPASQTYSQLQGAIPHYVGSTSPASQKEFAEQELHIQQEHDEIWVKMLMGFCKHLAPIKYLDNLRLGEECFTKAHLLELLYCTVAPNLPLDQFDQQEKPKEEANETGKIAVFRKVLASIFQLICFISFAPINLLFRICRSEIAMLLITLTWKIIVSIFKLRGKSALNDIISATGNVLEVAENDASHAKDDGPLVEEIAIPSVTELSEISVKFSLTKGGIGSINFDKCSGVFYLPVVHLNDNSDVVIRNLVACEACIGPEAMVFTRYTELMNSIIDTEEDARILREAGVLVNRLKSGKEVASLWNGMTKSVRVTKVSILDKAIEAANGYYSESWKVKTRGLLKKYVYGFVASSYFYCSSSLCLL